MKKLNVLNILITLFVIANVIGTIQVMQYLDSLDKGEHTQQIFNELAQGSEYTDAECEALWLEAQKLRGEQQ